MQMMDAKYKISDYPNISAQYIFWIDKWRVIKRRRSIHKILTYTKILSRHILLYNNIFCPCNIFYRFGIVFQQNHSTKNPNEITEWKNLPTIIFHKVYFWISIHVEWNNIGTASMHIFGQCYDTFVVQP